MNMSDVTPMSDAAVEIGSTPPRAEQRMMTATDESQSEISNFVRERKRVFIFINI